MSQPYLILVLSWLLFDFFHSLLASDSVKGFAMRAMGKGFRFYRFIYSMLAVASLVFVLHSHFSCPIYVLWLVPVIEKIIAGLLVLGGLAIMIVCAKKYLPRITGIDVLLDGDKKPVLLQDGVNAYVRHPLYFGTLIFVWGMFLGYPYLNILLSCICITIYTLIGAKLEEKKLVEIFGEEYINYRKSVPMLVPKIF